MPAVKQAVSLVANTMDNGWIGRREVANLWLKDAVTQPEEAKRGFQSLEYSANLAGLKRVNPACPASLGTLKVSVPPAVKLAAASARPRHDRRRRLIRSLPRAHPSGFPSMSAAPTTSIVEDLGAALQQFAAIANDLKK